MNFTGFPGCQRGDFMIVFREVGKDKMGHGADYDKWFLPLHLPLTKNYTKEPSDFVTKKP